jgi:hypothetical protein
MPSQAANIHSIDAIRLLRGALLDFAEQVHNALVALELEARRPVEWVEHDRTQYWPREEQKAGNALREARLALQQCELTISSEDTRYCYDERKNVERAKRRLRTCEAKLQVVRKWRIQIHKEIEEFQVQIEKFRHYLDSDFLKGLTALERMAAALDRYTQQPAPANGAITPTAGESSGDSRSESEP